MKGKDIVDYARDVGIVLGEFGAELEIHASGDQIHMEAHIRKDPGCIPALIERLKLIRDRYYKERIKSVTIHINLWSKSIDIKVWDIITPDVPEAIIDSVAQICKAAEAAVAENKLCVGGK